MKTVEIPGLKIREALPKDVQAMTSIAIEIFWREYGSREKAEKAFRDHVARRWESLVRRRAGIVLVAERYGEVVGFLVFRWWFGWNGWLEVIAVREEHRGKGIGTRLIEELIRKAREAGYVRICFAVEQKETISFYERFGAQCFGELPDEEAGTLTLYYIPIERAQKQ